ncbi:repulsive guidance molecule A [Caerostris extrusa]|uniref:Repulsive guidance molecule A n=1 Tax=Caerostris extrusa TaxID=172846 RepID=A0AAV4SZ83_CAEEX|nr:repulsive guidance molecule A [Caerostris extrusa]
MHFIQSNFIKKERPLQDKLGEIHGSDSVTIRFVSDSFSYINGTCTSIQSNFIKKGRPFAKVTVIIRQHVPCAIEKTYEAQADFLPGVFADGSRWSGPGVRIHEEVPGKHIELNFRYINTRIIIRQSGSYLTFAARMPSAIAVQGAQENTLELCVRGCPRRERIDFERVLETSTGPKNEAIAACRALNITDFYFDACVFDYLTTGDDSFSVAARDAMMDIGPQSVVNGSLPVMPRSVESGQKSTMHPFPMLFVVLGLMWFFLVNR